MIIFPKKLCFSGKRYIFAWLIGNCVLISIEKSYN